MKKIILAAVAASLSAGCAITQKVEPAKLSSKAICVINNEKVRVAFRDSLVANLQQRGFDVRIAADDTQSASCPTRVIYLANWTWDLAMYMRRAELIVYEGDRLAGRALYDASGGGGRLDKFIEADAKIAEHVAELFPSTEATTAAPAS